MKLIVDIPEEVYKNIMNDHGVSPYGMVFNSIQNGTVLPKHGRLIDADKLWDSYHDLDYDFYEALDVTPTILEAWKGDNNEIKNS